MTKKEHEKELHCYPAGQHQDRIQADKGKISSGGEGRQRKPHCQITAH